VASAVRGAHAQLIAIAEKQELVVKELDARRRIVELVRKRVAGGASTKLDLSVAELAVSEVERARDDLAADEIAAATELGRLLGTTPVHDVAGRLAPDTRPPPPIDALVEATLASRPALAAEERRYHQREEIVRLEHARAWPWFRFTAIPRYRADGSDVHTRDFAAGIELTVPLLNLNGGPIQIAEASRDQEREVFAKLAGGIRRDLAGARDDIALRAETLRRYETEVLPGLDAQDKLLSTAVAGGQIDVVALTAAEGLILRQRATYVDMRLACYRAWLVLDRTAGRRYSGGGV
jgi:multidrug efflux system outer membrane protein